MINKNQLEMSQANLSKLSDQDPNNKQDMSFYPISKQASAINSDQGSMIMDFQAQTRKKSLFVK